MPGYKAFIIVIDEALIDRINRFADEFDLDTSEWIEALILKDMVEKRIEKRRSAQAVVQSIPEQGTQEDTK